MIIKIKWSAIWLLILPMTLFGQSDYNLLKNPGFEGQWNGTNHSQVPLLNENVSVKFPDGWEGFAPPAMSTSEVWFTDSVAAPDPLDLPYVFNTGWFGTSQNCDNLPSPWDTVESRNVQIANSGNFYVGFDAANGGDREGFQQDLGCPLNSGTYEVSGFFARPYNCKKITNRVYLGTKAGQRKVQLHKIVSKIQDHPNGTWHHFASSFTLEATKKKHWGLDWFSVSGEFFGRKFYQNYMFYDDLRLYRPCDLQNQCSVTSGQICPVIQVNPDSMDALRFSNIGNAYDYTLEIFTESGVLMGTFYHHNSRGMPEFYIPGRYLRDSLLLPQAVYEYKIRLSNDCGSAVHLGKFDLSNFYGPKPLWEDTTDTWTVTPKPCCLDTILIENTQIIGNVAFIARDAIIADNNVSIANGYDVTLQAPSVVELVNFDSGQSNLDVVNSPCPNKTFPGPPNVNQPPAQQPEWQAEGQSMETSSFGMPQITALGQNYPNPFREETVIPFSVAQTAQVKLTVFDGQMRKVAVLADGQYLPGNYQKTFRAESLDQGLYFVILEVDGEFVDRSSVLKIGR